MAGELRGAEGEGVAALSVQPVLGSVLVCSALRSGLIQSRDLTICTGHSFHDPRVVALLAADNHAPHSVGS